MNAEPALEIEPLYLPRLAQIVRNEPMTATERFFEVALSGGAHLGHRPGQFVEVSVFGVGEAPISISSSPLKAGSFEMCVRAMGNVTGALHALPAGSQIGIRGPLGNGFDVEQFHDHDMLFVCAGLGLAPLRSLIHYALERRDRFGEITILVGAKAPEELLFLSEVREWEARDDVTCLVTVDRPTDGWTGNVGVITTLFDMVRMDPRSTIVTMVGPPIMYRFAIMEAVNMGVAEDRILLDLERHMKCGVAKCGHCQINGKYVCVDGPVFKYSEVKYLPEAI
jgi:sulfhydrogenase subunit gamma (sulfur reductase)